MLKMEPNIICKIN